MQITDEMLTIAANKATNLGLLPQWVSQTDYTRNYDRMREILKATLATPDPGPDVKLAGMMKMQRAVEQAMLEAIETQKG